MKIIYGLRFSVFLIFVATLAAISGCSNKQESPTSNTAQPKAPETTSKKSSAGGTGTIMANPNPVKICDGSGIGVTTLTWTTEGTKRVQVHIGSPDGILFAETEGGSTKATGKWVGQGTMIYLQDISNGLPLTAENTLATVKIEATTAGCP